MMVQLWLDRGGGTFDEMSVVAPERLTRASMCAIAAHQDFDMNGELKMGVIGLLEEVLRDPDLLPQERKATTNILRCATKKKKGEVLAKHKKNRNSRQEADLYPALFTLRIQSQSAAGGRPCSRFLSLSCGRVSLRSALSQEEQDDAQLKLEDILQMVSYQTPAAIAVLWTEGLLSPVFKPLSKPFRLQKSCPLLHFIVVRLQCCLVNPVPTPVAQHVPVCGSSTRLFNHSALWTVHACVCVSVCVGRRRVRKQSVSSLCRPWSSPSRSPSWITLCSGASPTSEWFIRCGVLSVRRPCISPWNSWAEDPAKSKKNHRIKRECAAYLALKWFGGVYSSSTDEIFTEFDTLHFVMHHVPSFGLLRNILRAWKMEYTM